MITATAALAEGVIDLNTTVVDAGPIYLMNRYFPNDLSQAQKFVSWNHKYGIVHGALNVVRALALSNDIFFYYMGGGFPDQFAGLGQTTSDQVDGAVRLWREHGHRPAGRSGG